MLKKLRKKLKKYNKKFTWDILSAGIAFMVVAEAVDIISTLFGTRLLGLLESNVLMINPLTLDFQLGWAVLVKLNGAFFNVIVPAVFIYKGTHSKWLTSLLFWAYGFITWYYADIRNINLILHVLHGLIYFKG